MDLIDFSQIYSKSQKSLYSHYFSSNVMAIVASRTGSGKINLIMNLLTQPNLLLYCSVYIYTTTLYQESYVYLRQSTRSYLNI